ncbi:flagellar biosynthesis protein FlhF [Thiomicrorhabdus heinhorstiae]|uniref:Flagellar biosynthesis protein FlhF n=1 Tax=Thiomicrorhabdus heinhorstiae TaxID=2748010 RepID=A0ABS0BX38_9GAMM|nr:flagellar biosynthesis protein FlhF [Thiomicrorhabdus heinhorstiae]MBF6058363.1 flagellar biosynthesis protein FlhF [Thiomicrorhabdus heinhorstiae]
MKIKRYVAPTMRQAMNLVRQEYGDDAVILSTKDIDGGVEIVTALDPEAVEYKKNHSEVDSLSPEPEKTSEIKGARQVEQQPDLAAMASELQAMRSMLENQLSGLAWNQNEQQNPHQVALLKRLLQLGIGWDLSQKLLQAIDADSSKAWTLLLQALEERISVADQDLIERGGIFALVGPTGVGKTTTIAKLASRFVMRHSTNDIALITTDCYKIGAQAQLKTFADLIRVPVHVASTHGELVALLSSLQHKKMILIDTAGMSQRDLQLTQQLTSGHDGLNYVRNYLVISAATQLSALEDIVRSFGRMVLKGCILTKMDEALQLGNVLTVLAEENLPLAYVSTGQRVPEDLESLKVRELIDRAILLGQQRRQTEDAALRLGVGREVSHAQ